MDLTGYESTEELAARKRSCRWGAGPPRRTLRPFEPRIVGEGWDGFVVGGVVGFRGFFVGCDFVWPLDAARPGLKSRLPFRGAIGHWGYRGAGLDVERQRPDVKEGDYCPCLDS